jgi:hypothetical protein
MMKYIQAYFQASRSIKAFILTVILLMGVIVVTTVWAYARLTYARTNIIEVGSTPLRSKPSSTP